MPIMRLETLYSTVPKVVQTMGASHAARAVGNTMMGVTAGRVPSLDRNAVSTAATLVATAIRGGAFDYSNNNINLDRVSMRLDSINTYGIISALLLNATLRIYSMTTKQEEEDEEKEKQEREGNHKSKTVNKNNSSSNGDVGVGVQGKFVAIQRMGHSLFSIFAGMSVMCNSYSALVFSMMSLYSKTALGMGNDDGFLEFFDITADIRRFAFRTFLTALISFKLCFTTSLFLNYKGKTQHWLAALATALAIISWFHWHDIIGLAGTLLYRPR